MYIDLKKLNIINFSDGHYHLKGGNISSETYGVSLSIKSFDDLFLLAQFKQIYPLVENLKINYLLGARCDRRFSKSEALDLKIIAKFINNLGFKKVEILKPHSEISLALIDNSEGYNFNTEMLARCISENNLRDFSIISPDAGASKWIEKELGRTDIIQCNKDRDVGTGEIKSIKFSEQPKEVSIIVDDLCDGGFTFITLAKQLKAAGSKQVYLIITHGIFSKGFRVFDGLIDGIYCTNSFGDFEDKLLKQWKL